MKKLIPFIVLVIFVLLFALVVTKRPKVEPIQRTFIFFDTFVRISFYPCKGVEEEDVFPAAERELERIQHRFGYGATGLASLLGGQGDVEFAEEDRDLLRRAVQLSKRTDGAFDITIGLLEQVWGFKGNNPHLPREEEIAEALARTGYEHLRILEGEVHLDKGFMVDFGGISKGYAVDRVVEVLKGKGIRSGLVDAGGDLRVFGEKPEGTPWTIGIKHPQEQGALLGTFKIDSGAVATSGNYERAFTEQGISYHHIIDPGTGYPATGCVSVTVWADDAVTADAFATAVFVLGPERGLKLVESLPRIEAVIVFEKNEKMEIVTSEGITLQ